MNAHDCTKLISHEQFPIDDLDNPTRQDAIDRVQDSLAKDGCALLNGFLSDLGLKTILAEAQRRRHFAYFSSATQTNAYFSETNPALPDSHPVNTIMGRTNGFITSDHFGVESAAYQLYHWQPLSRFIADCLGKKTLHIYADPVSNMIVNVCPAGAQFNWHFDTNEFTITMLLKPASSGSFFEYAPNIRSSQNENYDAVSEVLNDGQNKVTRLNLNPGDLQIFLGRYSLHRVTKNTGAEERMLIIMSFTDQPELLGSKERSQQLYGKITEAHDNRLGMNDNLRD